jgi:hypothetical protein
MLVAKQTGWTGILFPQERGAADRCNVRTMYRVTTNTRTGAAVVECGWTAFQPNNKGWYQQTPDDGRQYFHLFTALIPVRQMNAETSESEGITGLQIKIISKRGRNIAQTDRYARKEKPMHPGLRPSFKGFLCVLSGVAWDTFWFHSFCSGSSG